MVEQFPLSRELAATLRDHDVIEARAEGCDTLRNGELLAAAETAGFDVLVTTDRNLQYQQNPTGRRIAIAGFESSHRQPPATQLAMAQSTR